MDVAQLAALDQAEARDREFDHTAARWARVGLVVALFAAGYVLLGLSGDVPLPSWAPAGNRADGFSPFAISLGLGLVALLVVLRAVFRAYDLTAARLRR